MNQGRKELVLIEHDKIFLPIETRDIFYHLLGRRKKRLPKNLGGS